MDEKDKLLTCYRINEIFNPSAPIDKLSLFGGRRDQISKLFRTVGQSGEHAIIYGERGVGKTSIANVLREVLSGLGVKQITFAKVNCEVRDTFEALWRRIFRE